MEIALAWQAEQAAVCPGCGHLKEEAWAEENTGAFRARVIQCHACAARDSKAASRAEDGKSSAGIYYVIE